MWVVLWLPVLTESFVGVEGHEFHEAEDRAQQLGGE